MKVLAMQVGELGTNCYIAYDEKTKACAVIDPGDEAESIFSVIEKNGLKVKYIFLTHGHFDHVTGAPKLRELTGAPVYINELDTKVKISNLMSRVDLSKGVNYYKEGDEFVMDSLTFKVLETPGHTPGCVVLICGDVMFSGDTLFQGSCGRTDLPGGSWSEMLKSLKRLYNLPDDYTVLSGHSDATTLSAERKTNVYMAEAIEQ